MKQEQRPIVTFFLLTAMFMGAMEATIVTTAMPTIVGKLGGFAEFSWVFSIFMLTQAVTTPIYGKLADVYGRKPVLQGGLALFILGSGLCGLSASMTQLIIFRAIQGIGAGAILPIVMTVIGDLYQGAERVKIQGALSSVWAIAAVVGPALGGVIVDTIGWPWVFWLNVPFGLIAMEGLRRYLQEAVERRDHAIDYAGATVMAVGVSAFLTALMQGGVRWPWTSWPVLTLLLLSFACLALFLRIQRSAKEPLFPVELMKDRLIAAANINGVITGGLTLGATLYLPTFAQGILGTSAIVAGMTVVAMSIGWPIAATLAGKLIFRFGYRTVLAMGMALCLVSGLLYLAIDRETGPLYMAFCTAVMGAGLGLASTTQTVSIQSSVSWQQRGIATSSNMLGRILGSTFWAAALGSLVNTVLMERLHGLPLVAEYGVKDATSLTNLLLDPVKRMALPPEHWEVLTRALAEGIHWTFWAIVISALLGLMAVWWMPGDRTLERVEGK